MTGVLTVQEICVKLMLNKINAYEPIIKRMAG